MNKRGTKQTSMALEIPPGTKTFRTSLSLPQDLAVGLNQLAKQLGISQSALVAALLSQALPDIAKIIDKLPDPEDAEAVMRFRGQSIDVIMESVAKVLKQI